LLSRFPYRSYRYVLNAGQLAFSTSDVVIFAISMDVSYQPRGVMLFGSCNSFSFHSQGVSGASSGCEFNLQPSISVQTTFMGVDQKFQKDRNNSHQLGNYGIEGGCFARPVMSHHAGFVDCDA
jgi:hypothetical protein